MRDRIRTLSALAGPRASGTLAVAPGPPASANTGVQSLPVQLPEGLRRIAPLMAKDRPVSGFSVLHGPSDDAIIGSRAVRQRVLDLSLYLDLAFVGRFPAILETPEDARALADRLLTGALRDRYLGGCAPRCRGDAPFLGWAGSNEFEREASFRAFQAEVAPRIVAAAPDLPAGLLQVVEAELGPYDRARGGFPIRPRRPLLAGIGASEMASRFTMPVSGTLPDLLPIAPDAAAELAERLGPEGRRFVYFAAELDFGELDYPGRFGRPQAPLNLAGVALHADPDLTELIDPFDARPEAPETAAFRVGGRLVLPGRGGPTLVEASRAEAERFSRSLLMRALVEHPDLLDLQEVALQSLYLFDAPDRARLLSHVHDDVDGLLGPQSPFRERYWTQLDEFQRRELAAILAREGPPLFAQGQAQFPETATVVCRVGLGRYDFEAEAFQIAEAMANCNGILLGRFGNGEAVLGRDAVTIAAPLPTDFLPAAIPVPKGEAEALRDAATAGDDRRRMAWVPSEVTIGVHVKLTGLRPASDSAPPRAFTALVELEGATLYGWGDLQHPLKALRIEGLPTLESVGATPSERVILGSDTVNLLLLGRSDLQLDEAALRVWAREQAEREHFGQVRQDPTAALWPAFFGPRLAETLVNTPPDRTLLNEFVRWNRARAAALPERLYARTRSVSVDAARQRERDIAVFEPGASGRAGRAEALGVDPARVVDGRTFGFMAAEELATGGRDLLFVLPVAAERYAIPVDVLRSGGAGSVYAEMTVEAVEVTPETVAIHAIPQAAYVRTAAARDGRTSFDFAPSPDADRAVEAERAAAEAEAAAAAAQAAAEARAADRMQALFGGEDGLHLVMRAGTERIEEVRATQQNAQLNYRVILSNRPINLPAEAEYARPGEAAAWLQGGIGRAIVAHPRMFELELLPLLEDADLVALPFPPNPDQLPGATAPLPKAWTRLAESDLVLVEVGGGAPSGAVLLEQSLQTRARGRLRSAMPFAAKVEELGITLVPEISLDGETEALPLRDLAARLAAGAGRAIVPGQSLAQLAPGLRNADVTLRRFPTEAFEVGIAKDHKEGPDAFELLGVKIGMSPQQVREAIRDRFEDGEIEMEGDALVGRRGGCERPLGYAPASTGEEGTLCLVVTFRDGAASRIRVHQVLPGEAEEAAEAALRERFGRSTLIDETQQRHGGAWTRILGWGAPLAADRAALGRIEAKLPPTVAEAVIWGDEGATALDVQLDDVTTAAEAEAAATPKIEL